MQALRFRLDLKRVVDVGEMVVGQIHLAHHSENFGALNFFLILRIHFFFGEDGPAPKLANFGDVGVGLEFVGPVFENLIEFADFDAHIILLYNLRHNSLHFLLFFNEFYHEVENIGTYIPPELLLRLCLRLGLILL